MVEVRAGNASVGFARADVPLTAGAGVASVLPMTDFNDVVGYGYHTSHPASRAAWLRWSSRSPT